MNQELLAFLVSFGETLAKNVPMSLGLAAIFTILTWFWARNPDSLGGASAISSRTCATDLSPSHHPLLSHCHADRRRRAFVRNNHRRRSFNENGHGPLAAPPLFVQMGIFLVGEDIILYWTHRLFHGKRMRRYHAIRHSSEELE